MDLLSHSAILLIHCPDQGGIIAGVTDFIFKNGGNIIDLDEHVDPQERVFFMRVEWDLSNFRIDDQDIGHVFTEQLAGHYQMQWQLHFSSEVPRIAIFVSKLSHCLYDLLSRCRQSEWRAEIPLIISNHPELEAVAKQFDIDFHVLPAGKKNKKQQEQKQQTLLQEHNIDLVVLARYMQVLSDDFIQGYQNRVINIHHSFLPAFPGARPYHSAHERGVKIIGATSHYVTAELDAGPIIEQDVTHVSHKDSIEDLIRKGRDLEKIVLSRAVWHHLQHKVLAFNNRTVVFA